MARLPSVGPEINRGRITDNVMQTLTTLTVHLRLGVILAFGNPH